MLKTLEFVNGDIADVLSNLFVNTGVGLVIEPSVYERIPIGSATLTLKNVDFHVALYAVLRTFNLRLSADDYNYIIS